MSREKWRNHAVFLIIGPKLAGLEFPSGATSGGSAAPRNQTVTAIQWLDNVNKIQFSIATDPILNKLILFYIDVEASQVAACMV